jgi:Mrp family chromosome partitioning ATPase
MGRMLETLRNGEGTRARAAETAAGQPGGCVVDWVLPEDEVPYIEVGGPNRQVELSPQLTVQHPPQAAVQPPHAVVRPGVVQLAEPRPMSVAFEPWPRPGGAPAALAAEIIAYHQPDHAASRASAELLERITQLDGPAGPRVLLLVGAAPHVGASTVLLNLAVVAARAERRVVLLDAQRARPVLAARLGLSAEIGLQDVCAGSAALDAAHARSAVVGLDLLPASAGAKIDPGAEAVAWLIACVRARYDLVLIDGPSLDEPAGLGPLVPLCDAVFLVAGPDRAAADRSAHAQTIARLGGRLGGLICTHFA